MAKAAPSVSVANGSKAASSASTSTSTLSTHERLTIIRRKACQRTLLTTLQLNILYYFAVFSIIVYELYTNTQLFVVRAPQMSLAATGIFIATSAGMYTRNTSDIGMLRQVLCTLAISTIGVIYNIYYFQQVDNWYTQHGKSAYPLYMIPSLVHFLGCGIHSVALLQLYLLRLLDGPRKSAIHTPSRTTATPLATASTAQQRSRRR